MAQGSERRRPRSCPGCWSDRIVRGTKVEGVSIALGGEAGTVPVYANLCQECGMVAFFVRVAEALPEKR
jgi:hypothetical protein